jgi:hypothetical protein
MSEQLNVEKVRPLKSLKEYFSQLYLIFCTNSMIWVLANDDHILIKYLYAFILVSLLGFRTISFFRKGNQYFLIEMCYIITVFLKFI